MENLEPKTRFEHFLNKIANSGQPLVIEVQLNQIVVDMN